VLPLLYPDAATREALLADPQSAPIPPAHRELFRFAEKFVRGSWETGPADLQRLRSVGLSERDVVLWATLGSTQSWFTMSADGGGVPLEGDALTGTAVGRTRDTYEANCEGLLAAPDDVDRPGVAVGDQPVAWVEIDESSDAYLEAARWAEGRYGFVPNLLRAVSLQPGYYRRHQMALELLEAPRSKSLSPRLHAMVRLLVSHLTRSRYSEPTTAALLARVTGDSQLAEQLRSEARRADLSPTDRVVLALATKFARNTYKVTEKDAISLRETGLDDEAYVDILNTVSIQTSLDRLANVLGVRPDANPLLARS
jgi:4-carboxymuconolactone decarboxylase